MDAGGAQPESMPSAPGIVSIRSPFALSETLERLNSAILTRGLTVFALIDHSGEAERVGLVMRPTKLLIFGSPRAGTPLMVASPLLALDLPLKVLVWQDQADAVWVSAADPAYLADRYAIPHDLVKNIAGIGALVEMALHA